MAPDEINDYVTDLLRPIWNIGKNGSKVLLILNFNFVGHLKILFAAVCNFCKTIFLPSAGQTIIPTIDLIYNAKIVCILL